MSQTYSTSQTGRRGMPTVAVRKFHAMTAQGQTFDSEKPLVSICIPTFNGARWIRESLNSALAQSYQPLEILIVDDASSDETVEAARSIKDERVRVIVNEQNLGLTRNWNRCVALARGEFIKFLFQDDVLYTDCVERMMQLFRTHESLGFVFAPRDIVVEGDTGTKETEVWLKNCRTLHTKFERLHQFNSGRELFGQYLRGGLKGNWVGEPSSVLIRKECFSRLGGFNTQMHQVCDVEMWLRTMFFYDVGFVSKKLSAFRLHFNSTSIANMRSHRNFLDQLWLLERLSKLDKIKSAYPELEAIRGIELLRFVKGLLNRPLTVARYLRTDPQTRQAFLLLPKWAGSAAGYFLSRLFRRRVRPSVKLSLR